MTEIRAQRSLTKKGHYVRSKGEQTIADILHERGIKYLYEPPLRIGKYTFHPDFYLSQYDIYIEYLGLWSDEDYRRKNRWKRRMYTRNRIRMIAVYPYHLRWSEQKLVNWLIKKIKTLNNLNNIITK